jgi:hypothetical protein
MLYILNAQNGTVYNLMLHFNGEDLLTSTCETMSAFSVCIHRKGTENSGNNGYLGQDNKSCLAVCTEEESALCPAGQPLSLL